MEAPRWSPDGGRVAFASRERAARSAEGDDERARPLFSRLDGTGWTIDRPRGVFVVAADGSSGPVQVAAGRYEHGDPVWVGERLVVSAARRPDADLDLRADLHLLDATGRTEPEPLAASTLSLWMPAGSSDGTRVAALAEDVALVPSRNRVVVVDVATGKEDVLSAAFDRQCAPHPGARAPLWRGEELLFPVEDHGDVHVYRVGPEGGPTRVVGGSRAIRGFDAVGDTLAFVASTPTALGELFVRDADGIERQLTHLGTGVPAAIEPEPCTVDGVDAWIVRPAGGDLPVLLSIHGGPMTQYAAAWLDEFQMWATAGYAVVYCNPHGSTGDTEAFSREDPRRRGARAPRIGLGRAGRPGRARRPRRAGPRSRGSTATGSACSAAPTAAMTTWLVANTDRFAAACSNGPRTTWSRWNGTPTPRACSRPRSA